jgi:lysophospholipase L1-like esterase
VRTRLITCVTALAVAGLLGAAVAAPATASPAKPKPTPKIKVLVLGDSVGQGLGIALQRDKKVDTVNEGSVSCTLAGGTIQGYQGNVIGSGCPDWRTQWPPLVQQNNPDVVLVVTGGWEIVDRWYANPGEGLPSTILDPGFAQQVADSHREAAQLLSAGGAKVVFTNMQYINPLQAEPPPPGVNGIQEIWWEAYGPDQPPPGYQAPLPGQPFVGSKHKTDAFNKILSDLAKQGTITVVDLNKFADPKGTYTEKLKGKQVRFTDHSHFNDTGYDLVVDWLVPKLQKQAKQK